MVNCCGMWIVVADSLNLLSGVAIVWEYGARVGCTTIAVPWLFDWLALMLK